MRQTSRAVALLLAVESAHAVYTLNIPAPTAGVAYNTNVFNPAVSAGAAPTNTLQLNSRTAGYVNKHTTYNAQPGALWGAAVTNKAKLASGLTLATATTIAGSSGCMACLNGSTASVWCSSTYSYLSTTAAFQTDTIAATHNSTVKPASGPLSITGAAFDNGSCCDTNTNFNNFVWTQIQRNTAVTHTDYTVANSSDAAGLAMVESACVAIASTFAAPSAGNETFGVSEINATTVAYSGWWCSNGLYKTVQSAGNITLNAQQTITDGVNKRRELAQVGCP